VTKPEDSEIEIFKGVKKQLKNPSAIFYLYISYFRKSTEIIIMREKKKI
jgi:hypothetical protein